MQRRIWTVTADGAHAHPIMADPRYRDEAPRWTPTGLFFVRMDAAGRVSLCRWRRGRTTRIVERDPPEGGWFGYDGSLDLPAHYGVYPKEKGRRP